MYQKNPKLGQLQAKVDPETLIPSIIFFHVVLLDFAYSQEKHHQEMTVAQIMNSLLSNSY